MDEFTAGRVAQKQVKPKPKSHIDLINECRQEKYENALSEAFPDGIPDVLNITPEQQLTLRNLKNRYAKVTEANIIDVSKPKSKTDCTGYVLDDGSKYYF